MQRANCLRVWAMPASHLACMVDALKPGAGVFRRLNHSRTLTLNSTLPIRLTEVNDGNRVKEDRNQRRRRPTLGRTLLLFLRDETRPARYFDSLFQDRTGKQRVLPLGDLELRAADCAR